MLTRKFRFALLALGMFVMAPASSAQTYQMNVVGISDGDTATLLLNGNSQVRCRLFGIDAPESGQAFGKAAKRTLSDAIYGKRVGVEIVDTDRYGRSVCRITHEGQDVNLYMVEQGYAWVYQRYNNDAEYIKAQHRARESGTGLWREGSPVPPWDWRKARRQSALP